MKKVPPEASYSQNINNHESTDERYNNNSEIASVSLPSVDRYVLGQCPQFNLKMDSVCGILSIRRYGKDKITGRSQLSSLDSTHSRGSTNSISWRKCRVEVPLTLALGENYTIYYRQLEKNFKSSVSSHYSQSSEAEKQPEEGNCARLHRFSCYPSCKLVILSATTFAIKRIDVVLESSPMKRIDDSCILVSCVNDVEMFQWVTAFAHVMAVAAMRAEVLNNPVINESAPFQSELEGRESENDERDLCEDLLKSIDSWDEDSPRVGDGAQFSDDDDNAEESNDNDNMGRSSSSPITSSQGFPLLDPLFPLRELQRGCSQSNASVSSPLALSPSRLRFVEELVSADMTNRELADKYRLLRDNIVIVPSPREVLSELELDTSGNQLTSFSRSSAFPSPSSQRSIQHQHQRHYHHRHRRVSRLESLLRASVAWPVQLLQIVVSSGVFFLLLVVTSLFGVLATCFLVFVNLCVFLVTSPFNAAIEFIKKVFAGVKSSKAK